jgi:hypothetical protein
VALVSAVDVTARSAACEVGPMGSIVLISIVMAAAVVILSDLFVTERRRRRTLRSYFVPQDEEPQAHPR